MRTVRFEVNVPKMLLTLALRPIWQDMVFSSLSLTRFVEIPDPPLPGPRWVRVRNHMCGICATDLHLLLVEGDPQVAPVALPGNNTRYLGHELVGEVIEAGPGVSALAVGDRVILDAESPNCFSQEIEPPCRACHEGKPVLCENASLGRGGQAVGGGWGDSLVAHESQFCKIPDQVDDETAVLMEPLSIGLRTVLRRPPQPQERVLVVGCGVIGLATIDAVRALSPLSHVTAMARYPQQVEMARKLGANELVVHHEDPYAAAARITGGKLYTGMFKNRMLLGGFDVIYDCVGTERTVQDSLRWARAGGTVVLAGVSLKRMRVDLTPVWYQEVDLIGLPGRGTDEHDGRRRSTYDLVTDLLLQDRLTADGLITHRFPLSQWHKAVRTARDKRTGAIKVVLDCRAEA